MLLALWSAYFQDVAPPVVNQSTGGISERDYKRYRKHLESMMLASKRGEVEKYSESVKIVEKIAVRAGLELPKPIAKITESKRIEYVLPDYYITTLALQELLNYIVKLRQQKVQESLDDDILIMMLSF